MQKKHKVIGIRELQHNLARVAKETADGKSFVVLRHAKPIFRIEPIHSSDGKTYTIEDLYDIQFEAKDKDLSKKIDRITYGL